MQWGRFVCTSCNQENTEFELVLRSAWELSSSGKQVARSNTPCQKGVKFGVVKVNGGQNIIMQQSHQCWKREASSVLKGYGIQFVINYS